MADSSSEVAASSETVRVVPSASVVKEEESSEARPSSPDPSCPICLDNVTDTAYTDMCCHRFCFHCLVSWSRVNIIYPCFMCSKFDFFFFFFLVKFLLSSCVRLVKLSFSNFYLKNWLASLTFSCAVLKPLFLYIIYLHRSWLYLKLWLFFRFHFFLLWEASPTVWCVMITIQNYLSNVEVKRGLLSPKKCGRPLQTQNLIPVYYSALCFKAIEVRWVLVAL